MILVSCTEYVRAISLLIVKHIIEIIHLSRPQRRFHRLQSGIADRARRKAGVEIGIVG